MKPAIRGIAFVVGSFGVAGAALFLLMDFSFCTLIDPGLHSDERRRVFLENVFVGYALGLSFYFLVLGGSFLLCVKAVASKVDSPGRVGSHLLMSSLLATAVIVLLLVPFLLKFG